MADLGSVIGKILPRGLRIPLAAVPAFSLKLERPTLKLKQGNRDSLNAGRYASLNLVPTNGIRTGTVKVNGVLTAGITVRIYYRETGQLVDSVKTNDIGVYRFEGLDPTENNAYFITALDPSSSIPFKYTLTHDHIKAVAA